MTQPAVSRDRAAVPPEGSRVAHEAEQDARRDMGRAWILEEIRRTAAGNEGTPLGSSAFCKKTGIPVSVWLGRFWTRWSDALVEAGFSRLGKQRTDDPDALLEDYARFAVQLGRLPTTGDLHFRDRTEVGHAHAKLLERRLGTKSELVRRLAEYCRRRTRYPEVASWCETYSPRERPRSFQRGTRANGTVYLARSGPYYTIGASGAAGPRRTELLARLLPESLTLVHAISTDDPNGIERYWLRRFEDKRIESRWLALDASDVAAFRRRRFM